MVLIVFYIRIPLTKDKCTEIIFMAGSEICLKDVMKFNKNHGMYCTHDSIVKLREMTLWVFSKKCHSYREQFVNK